ncbi:MAG: tRNA (N6-isopentenyl adenosine(37)-C2)-methylthiotransferase MiaB [candidate division Zixibacteria bacterium RBG_16_48_11]|nr:MAG: tRNA (N6-isopentenyl adenosine(37)-C2)-methylthiotransferase MiaB [candidate division Zixibacteria bacterium RBG_16_48_11]
MSKKVYLESYGCQMNEADSELIRGQLLAHGFQLVPEPKESDVILLNTCAVREHAEQRIYGRVAQLGQLKHRNPELLIGVCGCMASHLKEEIVETSQFVDMVIGPDSYRRLPEIIEKAVDEPYLDVRLDKYENYSGIDPVRAEGVRAWISIMRGCNKFCTFCIVPYVRGREHCLPIEQVMEQVRQVAGEGYREIGFLGQTVNSYKDKNSGVDFAGLLEKAAEVEGIERIRFMSPHPIDFDDKTIEVMKNNSKICPQVHLPLQSASNPMLDKMKRRYTIEFYDELLHKFREEIPGIAVTTDIIVGFPGEEEEHYQETYDYMAKTRYDSAFVFKYSPREGAKAYNWGDPIPEEEKVSRLEKIIKIQEQISLEINQRQVGKVTEVLVEGEAKKEEGCWFGKNPKFKTVVFPKDGTKPGGFVKVLVQRATPHTLMGDVVKLGAG